MISQALFSVAYLAIVTVGGVMHGADLPWIFAGLTAAVAFFARQLAEEGFVRLANTLAVTSWATGAVAGLTAVSAAFA